jgi:gliding motility-associated-like protein
VFTPVDASNIASGTIVSRTWNFGDNSPEVSGTNPTHSYASSGNYNVTLTVTSNNGCTNSISKDVTIYVLPDADFAANPVCEDEEMTFTNGTAVAYGSVDYEWTFGGGNTSTDVNPTFTFTGFGDFTVKLVATTNNGCQDSVSNVVTVWPKPVASFTVADVCLGEASDFVNSSTIAAGTIDENFWSFGDGASASVDNPSHTYATANETGFPVELRVVSDKGCADITTGTAIVWPLPEVNITADFREICDGDSAQLTANVDQTATSFRWNTEEVTQSIFAKQEGWYSVTVVGDPARGGCVGTDSIFITVWDNPVANAGNDTTIDLGSFAQLNGTGGLVYTWTPTTYLSDPDIANPIADDVRGDIEYILTVTDENGCIDDDSVLVTVIDRFNLIVYNTVTPNGDGDNDVWNIDNIQAYPDAEVTVINRYGMEVFNTTDYANNLWDGTFDGKDLPDGAYYYIITLPGNDDAEPFTGSINILRNR